MNKVKIILFLMIALLVISCGGKKEESGDFAAEMEALMNANQGQALLDGLVGLDKKYPDRLALKINISGMMLARNDIKGAGEYLKQGLPLVKKSTDSSEKYVFYTNMAQYSFKNQDPGKSVEYAGEALAEDKNDPLGVKLTMAKAYSELGDTTSSLKLFRDEWAASREKFSEEDLAYLLYMLGNEPDSLENVETVVAIADELLLRKPTMSGTGIQQAQVLEEAGYMLSALVASFSELDRSRFISKMNDFDVFSAIEEFKNHFPADTPFGRLLHGFTAYVKEDFDTANEIFSSITPEINMTYYSYLRYAAAVNSSSTSPEKCREFAAMEKRFPLFQGFYYYLWNGYKKNGMLSLENEELLISCILSNPASKFGIETKKELASLHGIKKNGENILLKDELMVYFMRLNKEGKPEVLEPLAKLMEMEDNVFKADAEIILREAEKKPGVTEWLDKRLNRK